MKKDTSRTGMTGASFTPVRKPIKRKRNPVTYIVSIVLSLVMIFYIGYHFISSFSSEIQTETSLMATENNIIRMDGYLFMKENILYSAATGTAGYNYTDGTKVKLGSTVANIYDSATVIEQTGVVDIDSRLGILEQANSVDGITTADTTTIDSQISELYYTIRQSSEKENYSNIPNRRDEFLTLLNKRQIITGEVENFNGRIQELQSQKDSLTMHSEDAIMSINSPYTGFFYSSLDGYEALFDSSKLESLSFEDFDELTASEPEQYPDTAIGKVVTEFNWYVVCMGSREDLKELNKNFEYKIQFPYNNDIQVTFRLSDVIYQSGSNRIMFIFECYDHPDGFNYKRMQNVSIISSSYSGYKIPTSAVHSVNGTQGVYILVGNIVEFREINIILKGDGYYIVAPQDTVNDKNYYNKLGLYDSVIVSGKNLYDGKIVT